MRRKIFIFITVVLMLMFSLNAVVYANENTQTSSDSSINTLDELNAEITSEGKDGSITDAEALAISEDTSPKVLAEYAAQVDRQASDLFAETTPEMTYVESKDTTIYKYEVQVDEMSSAVLVITDQPDIGPLQNFFGSISNMIVSPAYAATNGEELWKNYGYRYFTAVYTRACGPGYAKMCTENHYTLSASGVEERYAETWPESFFSVTGDIYSMGTSMEDQYATTPGASDAHIKTRITFKYTTVYSGVPSTSYLTVYERTKIGYLAHDAVNDRIKVVHSWEAI